MISKVCIKPPALRTGDTIAVVSPGAAVDRDHLTRGVEALRALDYRVKISAQALAKDRILAGDDKIRAQDLMRAFCDPEIKAIFAARGGYGSGRLLPLLDFDAVLRNPKIFLGFSDQTFLLNAIVRRCGLVCFHGPMVAKDLAQGLSPRCTTQMCSLLAGELIDFELTGSHTIVPGVAEGKLIGGCLSIVVAMLATPYAPEFEGAILFLEDTGEKAYRIDRMLVQLRQAQALGRVAGIVFGGLRSPENTEAEQRLVVDFVKEQTMDLGVPVLWGIEAGHGTENFTIPLGARACLDAGTRRLKLIENAVN